MGEQKYRHEYKYLVDKAEVALLQNRIKNLAHLDSNVDESGIYSIRSLYFDDIYNRCMQENENGDDPREKFRIRIYNQSDKRISLECKRKENGMTLKKSCRLSREQTEILMRGQYLRDISDAPELLKKLTIQMMMNKLRPIVIVDYDRIPYVYKDGNVRITFDTNLASSNRVDMFFEKNIPKRPIMPVGQQLMEVKFDELLPDVIYRNLQLDNLQHTAYSKYYLCRKYTLR